MIKRPRDGSRSSCRLVSGLFRTISSGGLPLAPVFYNAAVHQDSACGEEWAPICQRLAWNLFNFSLRES